MTGEIKGGINIAMKIPSHQYAATVAFYRDVVGLEPFTDKAPAIGFMLGSNRLWLDEVVGLSHAEIWLELFSDDFDAAAAHLQGVGVIRDDRIEELGEGFRGGWFFNPAGIVHLVREPDAW